MKLVYKKGGIEVHKGDLVILDDQVCRVERFTEPHKPSSTGTVEVYNMETGFTWEFFVGVIGATWIDREDIDRSDEYSSNTLELMLEAERRDICWVDVASEPPAETDKGRMYDPFDGCDTVVKCVRRSIEFEINVFGEADHVGQEHYLSGRNYDPELNTEHLD